MVVNMKLENLKNYLKEKINGWYKNSEIDYGVTGKFIDCETSENYLFITFEEDGQKLKCEICWYQEYNAEQIYNIWMESEWKEVA